jgi:hypothetical protein
MQELLATTMKLASRCEATNHLTLSLFLPIADESRTSEKTNNKNKVATTSSSYKKDVGKTPQRIVDSVAPILRQSP